MITILNAVEFLDHLRNHDDFSHSGLLKKASTEFIANVKTTMATMIINNQSWLLTINQKEYRNALICSPYTTYVTYPLGERKKFKKTWIRVAIVFNTVIMSLLCRATKINKIVQINNSLNSLIKHPVQFSAYLPLMTKSIIAHYPHHAVTFFRVNETLDTDFLQALKENGYLVFPDRSSHIFSSKNNFIQRSHTKRDITLLRKSPYTVVTHDELKQEDAARLAELYRMLFVDKHSHYNPIYTEAYFRLAIENHWHHYTALRHENGRIDAFISWFESENVMSCGPLGYDLRVDSKIGLYRKLVALCLKRADESQLIFNMGGGSDEFKLNRGSMMTWDYTAVFCSHLPFYRCIPWKVLSWIFNTYIKKIVSDANL